MKNRCKKQILDYFKANNIPYKFLNEESRPILLESADTIYLCVEVPEVIGGHIETSIRFYEDYAYCKSYFCQPVVDGEQQATRAARMLNYINMSLEYDCYTLYPHTFILDEKYGDILLGCAIRYELFQEHFHETMHHILNYGVQILVDVSAPLLGYIYGVFPYDYATTVGIERKLLDKRACPGNALGADKK